MTSARNWVYQALRRSERFFKTDMIYLAKGGFWLSLKQGSSILLSFLLAIAFANFLTKEDYGIYKYIISLAGIIGGFTLAGFKTSIIQSVAKGSEGSLKEGYRENLRWSIIVVILSITVAVYYFLNQNYILAGALLIIGFTTPLTNSASLYEAFLVGRKDFRTSYRLHITRSLIAAFVLFTAIVLSGNPLILSAVNFIVPAIFAYSAYRWVILKKKPNELVDEKSMSYGRHLSFMSIVTNFTLRFDSILIFHYLGAAPLAIYSFASAIPDQVIALLKQAHFLALPKLSQTDKKGIKRAILYKSFIIFLVMMGIFLIYALVASLFFQIFFPQYLDAVPYSRLFALNFVLAGFTLLPGTFLDSQSETKYKYIFTWFNAILRCGLMFILIFPYGIYGIILGELISRVASGILLFYLVKKV